MLLAVGSLSGPIHSEMLPMFRLAGPSDRWSVTDLRLARETAWGIILAVNCLGLLFAGVRGVASLFLSRGYFCRGSRLSRLG